MSGKIYLSPLEKYELTFSLLNIGKWHLKFLFSLLENGETVFSFSSWTSSSSWSLRRKKTISLSPQKLRIFFLICLFLLETGERNFRFLFLLSKLDLWKCWPIFVLYNTITDGGSTAPLYCWYHTEEKSI